MKRQVVILGPPGSGKGTITAQLERELSIPHISSGQRFRDEVKSGLKLGRQLQVFIDKGDLVPDGVVLEFVERWLGALVGNEGFLLDGFPRTVNQARAFDGWLVQRRSSVEVVLFFDCDLKLIEERITGRWVCPRCGRGYHVKNLPPKVSGMCDDCHVPLIQRPDDTVEVLQKRLRHYFELTEPLIAYYRSQGKLTVIDAGQPIDKTFAASVAALKR